MNQIVATIHPLTQRIRNLVLAAAASVAILAVPATQAHAADNSPDPGVRCAAKIAPGEYEFYLPGERATDKDGNKWVCGPDGQWFRDYSSLVRAPVITKSLVRALPAGNLGSFTLAR